MMADTPYKVTERRPIGARSWKVSQQIAHWLAVRGASPNGISIAGMSCAMASGVALASTSHFPEWARLGWLAGAALMQMRLLANMFDGMVAMERNVASAVGELFNEVPDRVSDAAIFIGAGYAASAHVALGYTAACVAIFVAYVRAVGKASGAPNDFCGPMAKQHRMATLTVVAVYCAMAPSRLQPPWGSTIPLSVADAALIAIIVGGLLTAVRRLSRIATFLRKRTV